ncbi:hypothetical protein M4S82_09770 [Planococcus sp. MERTA32b]|nr:hypothetical protein [Planococcus sp. MER TA 32b]
MKKSKGSSMNPRLFFSVLSVIIIGWIAATAYAYSQQLEHPVYLDHYFEDYAHENLHMQFYYITNKDDNNTVNMITLGDIPAFVEDFQAMYTEGPSYVQQFGLHELRTLSVKMDPYELSQLKEKVVINEITVYLSDGDSYTADIGEIIIHPEGESTKPSMSQMSSGEGELTVSYIEAGEEITINGFEPHLPPYGMADLKVHVPNAEDYFNGVNYVQKIENRLKAGKGVDLRDLGFPLNLKKNGGFAISIQNRGDLKYVLNSWVMIDGEDKNGTAIRFPASLYHIPILTREDSRTIIERKGAGK